MINQYSFIFISLGVSLIAGLVLLTHKPQARDFIAFGAVIASLIAAWVILRPVQTPLMDGAKKVNAMIGAGKPVLLEFQSPY